MKRLRTFCLLLCALFVGMIPVMANEIVYYETFGTDKLKAYELVNDFTGWSEKECVYSGIGSGVKSTNECDLDGSSKGNYVYFQKVAGTFKIEGIQTYGYSTCSLSFNMKLENTSDYREISVQCVADGVAGPIKTISATTDKNWHAVQCDVEIPEAESLQLIFTRKGNSVKDYIYIDDIRIMAESRLAPLEPAFSIPSGKVYPGQMVEMSTKPSKTDIYYTVDGSEPDETSLLYEQPVEITETCTLKAVAVAGDKRSTVATADYTFTPTVDVASVSGLSGVTTGSLVRLVLEGMSVTALSETEVVLQDAMQGLLLQTTGWTVPVGLSAGGFVVGTLVRNDGYAFLTDVDSRYVERGGILTFEPMEITLDNLVASPSDYILRLICLDEVGMQDGRVVQGGSSVPFVDRFSVLPDGYEWPENFALNAVPMYDGEGNLILAVIAVVDLAEGDMAPVFGTAWVVPYEGINYAVVDELNTNSLSAREVFLCDDCVLVNDGKEAEGITWIIENNRIRTPKGKYLGSMGTTDNLGVRLYDSYSKATCFWEWNEEYQAWCNTTDRLRTLLFSKTSGFKLFAMSNINSSGYSGVAHELPVIPGHIRTVAPDNFGTVCIPYAVDCSRIPDCKFYSLAGKKVGADGLATELVLEGPLAKLEAGSPYLFRTNENRLKLPYRGKMSINPKSVNGLIGVFAPVNPNRDAQDATLKGCYVLTANNVVGRCAAGSSLGANRAYIKMDEVPVCGEMPLQCLSLPMEELSSGIVAGVITDEASTEQVYTIQGIRLRETDVRCLSPGVYIINGRKVIVGGK